MGALLCNQISQALLIYSINNEREKINQEANGCTGNISSQTENVFSATTISILANIKIHEITEALSKEKHNIHFQLSVPKMVHLSYRISYWE